MSLTQQGVSEELVRLDLIEWCLKEALLAKLIIRIIVFQILEFLSLRKVSIWLKLMIVCIRRSGLTSSFKNSR